MKPLWNTRWLRKAALALSIVLTVYVLAAILYVLLIPYPVAQLAPEASTSCVLTDRHGEILRRFPLASGGRAQWLSLDRIPSELVDATLAGEDSRFFQHPGVDLASVARAIGLVIRHGRVMSGASTLTMQLVRMVEPHPKSVRAKLGEMLTALRLERAQSKRQILEQYLNRAYYGNGAYGVEAASQRYFGKPADALGPGEAILLAVLPRAPKGYDPLRHLDAALSRREHVLDLMTASGRLAPDKRARIEREPIVFAARDHSAPAGHFVDLVMTELGTQLSGGVIRTTLDAGLQRRLESAVADHVAKQTGLTQAGVVVLDPSTGAVRAMVGSAGYDTPGEGQNNILTTLRHPGSALKPFLYAMAIERGKTPASLARDSLAAVSGYHPHKPMREHGSARFRESLAGSYNLAAVEVLDGVGVAAALEGLRGFGLGPLAGTPDSYGLDLALGSARVRLLDLAAAYGFLVNGGEVFKPRLLEDRAAERTSGRMDPNASWLVMDMLSDPDARRAVFGADLPLDLPFKVAAKTGTSSGFSDTVTIAATREAIAAAWAGSFDGTGSKGRLAMWSAAPLVRVAMQAVADRAGHALTLPPAPAGLVARDVCRVTGELPGRACPRKHEHFVLGQEPRTTCARHLHETREARPIHET
jgi:penicillin-binding protein 1C